MPNPDEDADIGADDAVETKDTPEADTDEVDAGETEVEEPDGEAAEESEEEAPKRGETRMQRLANEARREREARIAAEARAEALSQSRTTQRDDSGETARIRAEKLALMDPTERRSFEQDERIERMQREMQGVNFNLADNTDKLAFERKALTNPMYAKNTDWVEQQLKNERAQGRYPTREALALLKIGYDVANAKPSKKLAAKKAEAAERVKSAKAPATNARSDVSAKEDKGESASDLRARILERERIGATS